MTAAERYIDSLELFGMAFGLDRMRGLLARLGNPERSFDAIHVVGTNGKGSTVLFTEALLEAEGVHTGAYLSPHITSFRERIRIRGAEIAPDAYEEAVLRVRDAAGTRVTQFEALTAAAFCAFEAAGVEWGVVEAGLGGRLDATNVLPRSRVQVLTNISLEHTQLLGTTREAIAAEKLAVVPEGGLLVVGEPEWGALAPQAHMVEAVRAEGTYQDQNRAVAQAAAELALGRQVDPSRDARGARAREDGGARARTHRDMGWRPQPGRDGTPGRRAAGARRGPRAAGRRVLDARREGRGRDGEAALEGM